MAFAFNKKFIFFAILCSFCITTDYTIVRPVSLSLFLSHFSSSWVPYAWLISVPVNLGLVALYNVLVCRFSLKEVMWWSVLAIGAINTLCIASTPFSAFCLFIWKDLYVLLMLQEVWSYLHTHTELSKAKFLYGVMFGLGGFGGAFGGWITGKFASTIGSANLLWASPVIYAFFALSYILMLREGGVASLPTHDTGENSLALFKKHPLLIYILCIVIFMQMASAFFEFQFTTALEKNITLTDLRTAYSGKVYFLVSLVKIFFQFIGTYLLVRWIGLRGGHFAIPSALFANALILFFFPTFACMTFGFITIKSFEYSLFNLTKEMLYIPLPHAVKFHAKPYIDIFAYRGSKALSSLLIIFIRAPLLIYFLLLLLTIWIGTVVVLYRKGKEIAI